MFKKEIDLSKYTLNTEVQSRFNDLQGQYRREKENLEHEHKLAMSDLKFEMKNFKDSEILKKNKEIEDLTNKNAVLTKENEMMNKMVDINADIVDVKDIINQLIKKLPEVNFKELTVNTSSK